MWDWESYPNRAIIIPVYTHTHTMQCTEQMQCRLNAMHRYLYIRFCKLHSHLFYFSHAHTTRVTVREIPIHTQWSSIHCVKKRGEWLTPERNVQNNINPFPCTHTIGVRTRGIGTPWFPPSTLFVLRYSTWFHLASTSTDKQNKFLPMPIGLISDIFFHRYMECQRMQKKSITARSTSRTHHKANKKVWLKIAAHAKRP